MSNQHEIDAYSVVESAFGRDLHLKRVLSLANAATGALSAATFGVAAIGRALAVANSLDPKHAIKQVDRLLLSNNGRATPLLWKIVVKSKLQGPAK